MPKSADKSSGLKTSPKSATASLPPLQGIGFYAVDSFLPAKLDYSARHQPNALSLIKDEDYSSDLWHRRGFEPFTSVHTGPFPNWVMLQPVFRARDLVDLPDVFGHNQIFLSERMRSAILSLDDPHWHHFISVEARNYQGKRICETDYFLWQVRRRVYFPYSPEWNHGWGLGSGMMNAYWRQPFWSMQVFPEQGRELMLAPFWGPVDEGSQGFEIAMNATSLSALQAQNLSGLICKQIFRGRAGEGVQKYDSRNIDPQSFERALYLLTREC
jgi:hypothetical protein